MKIELTQEEKNLTIYILDMYVDKIIKKIYGKSPTPKVMLYVEELETIKCIFIKMLNKNKEETIRGVITKPKSALEDLIEFSTTFCEENKL